MDGKDQRDLALPQELEAERAIEIPEYLNLAKIEEKAKQWNKDWDSSSGELINNWEENKSLYKNFEKNTKKRVTTKVPEIWAQIQTELPHLINSIFSRSEVVRNEPKFAAPADVALKVKLYVNSAILSAANARYKVSDTIQNCLVYGTAITKSYWDLSSDYTFNHDTGDWDESVSGKPNFMNISNFDFAIDPSYIGHDVNQAEWARHRTYYKKEDLKRMQSLGEVENFSDDDLGVNNSVSDKAQVEMSNPNRKKAYVDEFWATIYWEEDEMQEVTDPITGEVTLEKTGEKITKRDEFFFWLLNDKKVIKFKKNWFRFKPFMATRCYRVSDGFWGQGEVDIMKAYADQMSDIHTKAGVLAKRVGGKLTFYTPESGFNKTDAKNMENGLVMVNDLNQIKSENTTAGADLGVMLQYKGSIKNDIETATGINNIVKGEPVGDQTATEASLLNQNSTARLTGKLQNIQDELMVPLASQFFKISKQFIEEFSFSYKGEMVNMEPRDFVGEYDWSSIGSISQSNKALQIKQKTELAMQLSQAALQAPMVKAAGFDLMAFIQNEIMPNFDIVDASRYFVTPTAPQGPGPQGQGDVADTTSETETIAPGTTVSDSTGNSISQEASVNTLT